MTKNKARIAIAIVMAGTALAAHAQTSPIRPAYSYPGTVSQQTGPASIQLGSTPLFFTPYIGVAAGHDDNVLLTNRNERSSTLYVTSPGFKIDARSSNSLFQTSYQGQVGRYADSEDDDYVDHASRTQWDIAFSGRSFLRLGFDYIRAHDPRGSTDRPIQSRPDQYELTSPNATYAFGAPGAQGRVELYAAEGRKVYLNNRDTTFLNDHKTRDYGGAFYWRVMPKTYALAEVRQTDISYLSGTSPLSGYERRYFGGVTWEATALTTGTVKVGRLEKKFNNDLPDFSSTSWEAAIKWAPLTYSVFEFYSARTTNESTGLGRFILSDMYGVNWTHAWNSVISTGANLRYQRDEYQGFGRSDDTTTLGLKFGYKMRRWLILGAEYTFTRRDSNINTFDYDKNLYLLTATASM